MSHKWPITPSLLLFRNSQLFWEETLLGLGVGIKLFDIALYGRKCKMNALSSTQKASILSGPQTLFNGSSFLTPKKLGFWQYLHSTTPFSMAFLWWHLNGRVTYLQEKSAQFRNFEKYLLKSLQGSSLKPIVKQISFVGGHCLLRESAKYKQQQKFNNQILSLQSFLKIALSCFCCNFSQHHASTLMSQNSNKSA